jgi:hypothetical protein
LGKTQHYIRHQRPLTEENKENKNTGGWSDIVSSPVPGVSSAITVAKTAASKKQRKIRAMAQDWVQDSENSSH